MNSTNPDTGRPNGAARSACRASLLAGALLLPLWAAPALATTERPLSLQEIVAAADTVIEGRVEAVRTVWRGRQIWTEVTLAVIDSFKGPAAPARVSFVQLGGRVTAPVPLEMSVPGSPIHATGDHGFYFLEPRGGGDRVIVGDARGRVSIRRGPRGDFVSVEGRRRSPAEFAEEIRRLVAGQPAPPRTSGDGR